MSRISRRSLLATTGMGILSGGLRRVLGAESTSDSPANEDTSKEPEGTTCSGGVPAGKHAPLERNAGAASQVPGHRFPYPPDLLGTRSQWCFPGSGTRDRRSAGGIAARHGAQEYPRLDQPHRRFCGVACKVRSPNTTSAFRPAFILSPNPPITCFNSRSILSCRQTLSSRPTSQAPVA